MARLMPVLPLVGSRTVQPGVSRPSFSACSTLKKAGRALTEPVGVRASGLAQRRIPRSPASQRGDRFGRPTSGVRPSESRSESKRAITVFRGASAAGNGRQDRDDATAEQGGTDPDEKAPVLVVKVDVDKPVERAIGSDEPLA